MPSISSYLGGKKPTLVELTGSGSWTVPTGVSSIRLFMVGGGGGGGASVSTGTRYSVGGGSAAGLYGMEMVVTPGAAISFACGAGGAGGVQSTGASGSVTGSAGGDTTFGDWTARGGVGAQVGSTMAITTRTVTTTQVREDDSSFYKNNDGFSFRTGEAGGTYRYYGVASSNLWPEMVGPFNEGLFQDDDPVDKFHAAPGAGSGYAVGGNARCVYSVSSGTYVGGAGSKGSGGGGCAVNDSVVTTLSATGGAGGDGWIMIEYWS